MNNISIFNARSLSRALAFVCALSFAVPTLPAQESLMSRVKNYFSPAATQKVTDFLHKHPWLVAAGAVVLAGSASYAFIKRRTSASQAPLQPRQYSQTDRVVVNCFDYERQLLKTRALNSFREINLHCAGTIILFDECMKKCCSEKLSEDDSCVEIMKIMDRENFIDTHYMFSSIIDPAALQILYPGAYPVLPLSVGMGFCVLDIVCEFGSNHTLIEHPLWKSVVQRAKTVLAQHELNMFARCAMGYDSELLVMPSNEVLTDL